MAPSRSGTSSPSIFRLVAEQNQVPRTGAASADIDALVERGFLHQVNNRLQRPSRLLTRFLDEQPNESSATARLFAEPDAYRKHLRGVLERRIEQIKGIDSRLRRYLQRATEDLPEHPDVFLTNVRGIVNQALELIWKVEIPNKRIPSEWMAVWKRNQERYVTDWETTFPQGVQRVRLLNVMTGTDKSQPCAKYITKSTFVLMNAAHAFGDFGQHQEGAAVDVGMAYAALYLCIELAAALVRELPTSA
jgi:hypothetical protein